MFTLRQHGLPHEHLQLHQHGATPWHDRGGAARRDHCQHTEGERHVLGHVAVQEGLAPQLAQGAQQARRQAKQGHQRVHAQLCWLLRGHLCAWCGRSALGQHNGQTKWTGKCKFLVCQGS